MPVLPGALQVSTLGAPGPATVDNYAPVMRELDVASLKVRGGLPRELNGTLYRNGPNPHFPLPDAHWFTGDGMLHAIALHDGKASYRNRWVRTPKWLAEERAGRALYLGFAGRMPDAPDWAGRDGGVANTHIVRHGGRLMALEEAHMPTLIDPVTLETLGYAGSGALRGPFTAHPKVDPKTGEMLFFGYNAAGPLTPEIHAGAIAADGRLKTYRRFETPYASMVHDFMVTERFMLFPILPLTGSLERARRGGAPYAWEPEKGAYVGVLPRGDAAAAIRWYRGEACYAFHVMNAWEEGDCLVADVMAFPEPPLFPHADGAPGNRSRQRARLTRWTFDLAADTDRFDSEVIGEFFGEFPRIDDRRAGTVNRHGWYAASNPALPTSELSGLVRRDGVRGDNDAYWLPEGDVTSEPVFAECGAGEGEGWVLAVVWRAALQLSEMLVFDALDLAAGPVATVEMPQRIPFGFHGNFVSETA
jgi:carotenoid cleavage dioxygenase